MIRNLKSLEDKLQAYAAKCGYCFLRISIGIIYLLYGVLKFFPQHSPAEQLAKDTINTLTCGIISGSVACITLALQETLTGICFIFGIRLKWIIYLAFGHMMCTFLPFFFFPGKVFNNLPLSFSIEGQYILKNLIIMSALLVLYAQVEKKKVPMPEFHEA